MNILHDKSSVKSFSAKWIDRGYAREDVHSLRLQYVYTPEQQEANRQICDAGPDEAHRRIKQAAESKNAVMASVMAAIAREFICYQYESEDPAPYGSSRWELFFWCNDFSNTLHGYGLSGRDYSYFTLSFNLAQTVEQRAAVCGRVLQFLETRFHSNPNLEVAVQYTTWYDKGKIKADAKKVQHLLDGRQYTYASKEGKFIVENGQLLFHPKYAKKYNYRVDDSDILAICWELDLTPNTSTVPAQKPMPAMGRQGPLTFPYEKYGSVHPIQLKVSAYMDGNLAIAMHTWENGYAEPWASLTVNLDGERGKDCAFIDTNGDADFPVWLIRHGLAIPTGATQRSGYCEYPEYRFRADRLRELDPEGYAEYLSLQEGRRSA